MYQRRSGAKPCSCAFRSFDNDRRSVCNTAGHSTKELLRCRRVIRQTDRQIDRNSSTVSDSWSTDREHAAVRVQSRCRRRWWPCSCIWCVRRSFSPDWSAQTPRQCRPPRDWYWSPARRPDNMPQSIYPIHPNR